ncbi:MAG: hypothetical protein EPN60_13035 [Nevskiaceae bacterium]|nr:MAG: hypothetical protein EPO48_03765 [Nevskiaceae bacterium]TAM24847.1 MAG: hypothetical protein EPN60_13035 [Nevskiaceae bacterium]
MIRHDSDLEVSYTEPLWFTNSSLAGSLPMPVVTTHAYVELLNREGSLDGPVVMHAPPLSLLPAVVPLLVPLLLALLALSQLGWLGWRSRRRPRNAG